MNRKDRKYSMMIRERRTGIINIRKKSGRRASDEKIKSMASYVGRERDKLRKTKGLKYGKEGRTRRRVGIINVKVEITSDDEFRRSGNKIFKKSRKFSLEKSGV